MKKITLSILALSLIITAIEAQEKTTEPVNKDAKAYRHHPGKHRKQHYADFKNLNLSQEQQDKLIKINKDYRSALADLKKKEATTTVKDHKAQIQALNKKRRSDVDNVFTKEQKDQLQQMKMERKRKLDRAGRGTGKMKSALELSDEQSDRMKALRAYTQKKIKGVRENPALTDAQKKEQFTAIYKQQRQDIKLILTPEQVKKMGNFKSGRISRTSK